MNEGRRAAGQPAGWRPAESETASSAASELPVTAAGAVDREFVYISCSSSFLLLASATAARARTARARARAPRTWGAPADNSFRHACGQESSSSSTLVVVLVVVVVVVVVLV